MMFLDHAVIELYWGNLQVKMIFNHSRIKNKSITYCLFFFFLQNTKST